MIQFLNFSRSLYFCLMNERSLFLVYICVLSRCVSIFIILPNLDFAFQSHAIQSAIGFFSFFNLIITPPVQLKNSPSCFYLSFCVLRTFRNSFKLLFIDFMIIAFLFSFSDSIYWHGARVWLSAGALDATAKSISRSSLCTRLKR